jgi:FxLD family lantipeptide
MPPTIQSHASLDHDPFDLDIRISTDASVGDAGRGCDTSDGCEPTCASSCASQT